MNLRRTANLLRRLRLVAALAFVIPAAAHGELFDGLCEEDMNNPDKVIVVLGASYAQDWPIESIGKYRVSNKGINGNQSFEMMARFQNDVLDGDPAAVLIWGFINDLHRSPPENIEATKARIKRSFEEMTEEAESKRLQVILATEVTLSEPQGFLNWLAGLAAKVRGKTSYRSVINAHVTDINVWLKAYAESRNILLLDFERVLSDEDGWRKQEFTQPDGSHLTTSAYRALSEHTLEAVLSACESR